MNLQPFANQANAPRLSHTPIMAIRTEFESVIFRVTGGCLKPLDERTFKLVPPRRIELRIEHYKCTVMPFN